MRAPAGNRGAGDNLVDILCPVGSGLLVRVGYGGTISDGHDLGVVAEDEVGVRAGDLLPGQPDAGSLVIRFKRRCGGGDNSDGDCFGDGVKVRSLRRGHRDLDLADLDGLDSAGLAVLHFNSSQTVGCRLERNASLCAGDFDGCCLSDVDLCGIHGKPDRLVSLCNGEFLRDRSLVVALAGDLHRRGSRVDVVAVGYGVIRSGDEFLSAVFYCDDRFLGSPVVGIGVGSKRHIGRGKCRPGDVEGSDRPSGIVSFSWQEDGVLTCIFECIAAA